MISGCAGFPAVNITGATIFKALINNINTHVVKINGNVKGDNFLLYIKSITNVDTPEAIINNINKGIVGLK